MIHIQCSGRVRSASHVTGPQPSCVSRPPERDATFERVARKKNIYRSLKKFRSMSLALGINCERRVFAPVIANSLKVSSLITAKLLLRRRLHAAFFSEWTLLCSSMSSRFGPSAVTSQNTNHGKRDYRAADRGAEITFRVHVADVFVVALDLDVLAVLGALAAQVVARLEISIAERARTRLELLGAQRQIDIRERLLTPPRLLTGGLAVNRFRIDALRIADSHSVDVIRDAVRVSVSRAAREV